MPVEAAHISQKIEYVHIQPTLNQNPLILQDQPFAFSELHHTVLSLSFRGFDSDLWIWILPIEPPWLGSIAQCRVSKNNVSKFSFQTTHI